MNTGRFVPLRSGENIVVLGQETWHFAESRARRAEDVASIRLGVDDLRHWRGPIPLVETILGFAELKRHGTIRYWGVSNLDIDDMIELSGVRVGDEAQTNQIFHNLTRRGPEYAPLTWLAQRGIPAMGCSPIEQDRLLECPALQPIAQRHDATPAQVALAWVLQRDGVNAIPRARTLLTSGKTPPLRRSS